MKVLFVCLFPIEANNSAMMRNLALVNGLIANGCEIDFITIPPSQNVLINEKEELFRKINIIRTNGNNIYSSVAAIKNVASTNKLKKYVISLARTVYHKINIFDYTFKIANEIKIEILPNHKYDLVISSSDPKTSHLAVLNLIKQGLKYNKWIQYWGDPMAMDITNHSIYPNSYLRKIEHGLLIKADQIVYVSPCTLDAQKQSFPDLSSKMIFLPIPYQEEKIYPPVISERFTLGYFGAYMSISRNIIPLYDACKKLNSEVDLIIMGESDIELEETNNIKIFPRGNASYYESQVDLLVCVLNKKGTQIPGKIYHYAATNKPILIILDGEFGESIETYLKPYNRYIFCHNKEDIISNKVQKIISMDNYYEPSVYFNSRQIASEFLRQDR